MPTKPSFLALQGAVGLPYLSASLPLQPKAKAKACACATHHTLSKSDFLFHENGPKQRVLFQWRFFLASFCLCFASTIVGHFATYPGPMTLGVALAPTLDHL